jgi:hypothetical protein
MNLTDAISVARQLENLGAVIYVQTDAAGGGRTFRLLPSDVQDFLDNPEFWKAKQWGVTPGEMDEWYSNDRMPRCGAMTKAGRRCRNYLASETDPNEFAKLHGSRCVVHS